MLNELVGVRLHHAVHAATAVVLAGAVWTAVGCGGEQKAPSRDRESAALVRQAAARAVSRWPDLQPTVTASCGVRRCTVRVRFAPLPTAVAGSTQLAASQATAAALNTAARRRKHTVTVRATTATTSLDGNTKVRTVGVWRCGNVQQFAAQPASWLDPAVMCR